MQKKPFWQPQRKQDLICELLTSHIHGQNSKQLVFQTNNSTSSTCCQSKACKFKHHYKKQHGENCSATGHTGQNLETTLILEICLRKLWVLANKPDFCLPSCQKIQNTHWQKNPDGKSLRGSTTACSNSPPIQREGFSLAGWEMDGRVTEGSLRAVFFCSPLLQLYTFLPCKSFSLLSFKGSFLDQGLFHSPERTFRRL